MVRAGGRDGDLRGVLDRLPVSARVYSTLRTVHLVLASIVLPFVLMYGVSAVQMSHDGWFDLKPSVREQALSLAPGLDDARAIGREVMERLPAARGELLSIQATPTGTNLRIVIPGAMHDVRYTRATGATTVKTNTGNVMAMLNRLHHAAGVARQIASLNAWGWTVALVSLALVCVGVTGLWMWFLRRTERLVGGILLGVNLAFALVLIVLIRRAGP
jgi:hypothetical protein